MRVPIRDDVLAASPASYAFLSASRVLVAVARSAICPFPFKRSLSRRGSIARALGAPRVRGERRAASSVSWRGFAPNLVGQTHEPLVVSAQDPPSLWRLSHQGVRPPNKIWSVGHRPARDETRDGAARISRADGSSRMGIRSEKFRASDPLGFFPRGLVRSRHCVRRERHTRDRKMTRRALLLLLVAVLSLVGGGMARIQDEPVERDGRELIPVAMDFGFEQEGARSTLATSPRRARPPESPFAGRARSRDASNRPAERDRFTTARSPAFVPARARLPTRSRADGILPPPVR